MPRYFFDIKHGHKPIDPTGFDCGNDAEAIERANTLAIGVSLDKPESNPERHIAVRNDVGREVFRVLVYSQPSEERPAR
jgi:hypothetical protein